METALRLDRDENNFGVIWFRRSKKAKSVYDPCLWHILGRTKRLRNRQKRYLKRTLEKG